MTAWPSNQSSSDVLPRLRPFLHLGLAMAMLATSACAAVRSPTGPLGIAQQRGLRVNIHCSGPHLAGAEQLNELCGVVEAVALEVIGVREVTRDDGASKPKTHRDHYLTMGVAEDKGRSAAANQAVPAAEALTGITLDVVQLVAREVLWPARASRYGLRIAAKGSHGGRDLAVAEAHVVAEEINAACDFRCARRAAVQQALEQLH